MALPFRHNHTKKGVENMKVQAIKTITNGMTESQEAAVILKENDSDVIALIWERVVRHMDTIRNDELSITKRLQRDQAETRARMLESTLILSHVAGKTGYFWQAAAKQTVGFKYVTGWE